MKPIKTGNLAGYALILTACLLPISLPAQVGSNGQIGKGKKAYGVPISDKEITFKVVLPDVMTPKGPYTATVRVKEGAMAKIAAFRAGFAYAVIPVAQGIDNDSAYFAIYKLTQDDAGNESVVELEHLILNKGETSESTKTQHKLQIELVDISIPRKSVHTSQGNAYVHVAFAPARKDCCVTCPLLPPGQGAIQTCGDAVCASCGQCQDPGEPPVQCPPQN